MYLNLYHYSDDICLFVGLPKRMMNEDENDLLAVERLMRIASIIFRQVLYCINIRSYFAFQQQIIN